MGKPFGRLILQGLKPWETRVDYKEKPRVLASLPAGTIVLVYLDDLAFPANASAEVREATEADIAELLSRQNKEVAADSAPGQFGTICAWIRLGASWRITEEEVANMGGWRQQYCQAVRATVTRQGEPVEDEPAKRLAHTVRLPLSFTELPLASEIWPHFGRPSSRTCSTGELSGAATRQEVLLAVAVAVETSEKAAVDASRSFLKPASERTRRPSLALPLASEVIL